MGFAELFKRHKTLFLSVALASILFFIEWIAEPFYFEFQPGYLVFPVIAESVSVFICVVTFAITWHTFFLSKNRQVLFLGVAFLAVGMIDTMHFLSYHGMPDFVTENTVNKATQFWIAGRMVGTFSYFLAAFIPPDSKNPDLRPLPLLTAMLLVVAAIFTAVVFYSPWLPPMYIPETGLTPLKIYLEYFIVCVQVLTAVMFTRIYFKTKQEHYIYFIAALILSIYSELFFTFHYSYDTINLLGHVYKVGMFYLIYQTIFTDSIKKPYRQLMEVKMQLRKNMHSLEKKVEERTRVLAAQKKELERLNRLKTDLLAVCSHDMKSPIQGTILMLDLLMMEAEGNLTDEQKRTLESIRKNEEEIMALITNLLDVARRDEDAMALHPESTDFKGLLDDWSERQRVLTDTMEITFLTDIEDGGPLFFEVDAFKINQVLNNLMSNALKYTPYGGEIRLFAGRTMDGHLRVSLSNSGPAIEKGKLTRIFEKYVQASDSPEAGSTGLGLNIAKTIIEMHGGSIWAESEEGRGATFIFTLPSLLLSAGGTGPDMSRETRFGDAA